MRRRSRIRFAIRRGAWLLLWVCPLLSARADAFEPFSGTRALGMGGALRGAATGGAGPVLNPSGMSLIQSYNVEADYLFASAQNDSFFHGSVVDSTSGYRVAGGLYYTYHSDNPSGPSSGHGHEAGLALSFPFGQYVTAGGTMKYFRLSGDQTAVDGGDGGLTFDAGLTIKPAPSLSLGVVGMNLRDLHAAVAPLSLGYGVAFTPTNDVLLVLDGLTNFTADAPVTRKATRLMTGFEVLLESKVALRAGGGYDGASENGFFSAGFSAISEVGALDLGIRQDAFRHGSSPRETIAGVSLRLFVPQP